MAIKKIDEAKDPAYNMGLVKDAPRIKVMFLDSDNMDKGTRATACINGELYSYKRNFEVEVPDFVLKAFDQAFYEVKDSVNGNVMKIMRFPYQVIA